MKMTPEQARARVRAMQFPNSAAEKEAVREVDLAASEMVHRNVEIMRQQADAQMLDSDALFFTTATLQEQLQNEIRHPLIDGDVPGPQITKLYQSIRYETEVAARELRLEADRLDYLAHQLEEPGETVERLLARFPSLRRDW